MRGPHSAACTIIVGQPTAARLTGVFILRDVGAVELKGKSQAVQAYELLGERTEAVHPGPVR